VLVILIPSCWFVALILSAALCRAAASADDAASADRRARERLRLPRRPDLRVVEGLAMTPTDQSRADIADSASTVSGMWRLAMGLAVMIVICDALLGRSVVLLALLSLLCAAHRSVDEYRSGGPMGGRSRRSPRRSRRNLGQQRVSDHVGGRPHCLGVEHGGGGDPPTTRALAWLVNPSSGV
jgi:hypothetical protein